jgi:hypothetical protein
MKPIAQTFIINQPETGVEAVFLTSIDLYFKSKSSTYGIELQIRETINGYPTQNQLPYASKVLAASNVNISDNASSATTFTFDTPVLVRTNEQFALVLVPVGGNPDYNIWSASLGGTDVTSNVPIYTNNQLGSLFISSNDLNFTPIQNESMKYTLYTAQFTSTSATAVYRNSDSDAFSVRDIIGNFGVGEQVVVANNLLSIAAITSSTSFTSNEIVVQPNTATSIYNATAYGTYVGSESGKIVLTNVGGTSPFSNTGGGLKGLTSAVTTANFTGAPSLAPATYSNTTILVPTANSTFVPDFVVGNYIYVGTNTRSTIKVLKITGIDVTNKLLTVDSNVSFTDSAAIMGRVRADANLYGYYSAASRNTSGEVGMLLNYVTATTSQNFANAANSFLIGRSSGASARNLGLLRTYYSSITSQFTSISPKQTAETWNFQGADATSGTLDGSYTSLTPDVPYEFTDKRRVIIPKSSNTTGKSLTITSSLTTSNNKISPYIDRVQNQAHMTRNITRQSWQHNGYIITIANSSANATNTFSFGDTIWQSNSTVNTTATIVYANTSTLYVANLVSSNSSNIPGLNANGTSYITDSTSGAVANITAIVAYNEASNINLSNATRYISKNVILADKQDAEDLVTYIGAYRPANTEFQVYGKFLSGTDGDVFSSKDWSALVETSNPATRSSAVNRDDIVELTYDLPSSVQVFGTSAVANSAAATIKVDSTASFSPGQFIYFRDNANGYFNVRQVVNITNSTFLTLSSAPSVNTTNASVGYIPGLQSQYGAFRYTNNYSVARYTTPADGVFDRFKTFAVKIVLTSDTEIIVPRMTDMRCLALQV